MLGGKQNGSRYGIQTTSMTLQTPAGILAIDAGTGLPSGLNPRAPASSVPVTILFTHYHLDHLVGLPLLLPLYDPAATITLRGDPRRSWRTALETLVAPPYWPVSLLQAGAQIDFHDLPLAEHQAHIFGIRVTWCPVRHPQDCLAYRLEVDGRSYVVATDREHGDAPLDRAFVEFCAGADVLVHDAQYLPEEASAHVGWGHSTYADAASVAQDAGVGLLVLTHHEANRTDSQIDQLVEQARLIFPHTEGAAEGMIFATDGGIR